MVGIGYYSFFGDGGPAAKATLNFPSGVAVDLNGNIYIADQGTNRVRRVQGEGGVIAPSTPSELNTAIVNVQVQREVSAPIRDLEVAFSRSISGRRAEFEWKGTTDENGKATIRITVKDEPSFRRGGASGYYRVRLTAGGIVVSEWNSIPLRGGRMINLLLPAGQQAAIIGPFFGTPIQAAGKPTNTPATLTVLSGVEPLAPYAQDILSIAEMEAGTWMSGEAPTHYALFQNSPNPFNPATQIRYTLPQAGQVRLTVYNALGQVVMRLVDSRQEAGAYTVTWDAREMASGIYYYRLDAGTFKEIRRMVFLK
jgi:hypothetical protein